MPIRVISVDLAWPPRRGRLTGGRVRVEAFAFSVQLAAVGGSQLDEVLQERFFARLGFHFSASGVGMLFKTKIESWPTWLVAMSGGFAFLFSSFYLFVLAKVLPDMLEISNKAAWHDFWPKGVLLWLLCGVIALMCWPAIAVAQKCHEVLKNRMLG